jgi:hypothetical protein
VSDGIRLAAVALAMGVIAGAGCAAATVRRLDDSATSPHRAGILQIAWRTTLHQHGLFEPSPEECASGVLAGISPIHARLWVEEKGATVFDTKSPNGVFINFDRVEGEALLAQSAVTVRFSVLASGFGRRWV